MIEPLPVLDLELRRLLDVIIEEFAPLEIILFGSQARGDANDDSDFDMAVVMPEGTNRHGVVGDIYEALGRVRGRSRGIDIVVLTARELEDGREDIGSVTREIVRDGRTVYHRPVAVGV